MASKEYIKKSASTKMDLDSDTVPFPVCAPVCPPAPWSGRWSWPERSSWQQVSWRQTTKRAHRPGSAPPPGWGSPVKAKCKCWYDTEETSRNKNYKTFSATSDWLRSDFLTQWFDIFCTGGAGTGISTFIGDETRRGPESLSLSGSLVSSLCVSSGITSHFGGLKVDLLTTSLV